jgi:hypothetical protein
MSEPIVFDAIVPPNRVTSVFVCVAPDGQRVKVNVPSGAIAGQRLRIQYKPTSVPQPVRVLATPAPTAGGAQKAGWHCPYPGCGYWSDVATDHAYTCPRRFMTAAEHERRSAGAAPAPLTLDAAGCRDVCSQLCLACEQGDLAAQLSILEKLKCTPAKGRLQQIAACSLGKLARGLKDSEDPSVAAAAAEVCANWVRLLHPSKRRAPAPAPPPPDGDEERAVCALAGMAKRARVEGDATLSAQGAERDALLKRVQTLEEAIEYLLESDATWRSLSEELERENAALRAAACAAVEE